MFENLSHPKVEVIFPLKKKMILVSLWLEKIEKGGSMKSRFLFSAAVAMFMAMVSGSVSASGEFVLQIDSGEMSLHEAMVLAYPDAKLSADDVIVKKG